MLRDFLAEGVQERLTVAMYDFTARHVEDAVRAALEGSDATFRLVLDGQKASGGVGGTGINGPDSLEADVMKRLGEVLGDRFELARASVGAGGAVPKAYHIKVASVDGERLWLSSGNWQSSNLPPFDWQVAGDAPPLPIRRYNRDYHVVVKNPTLARCYAAFIEYDATLGGAFAGPGGEDEPVLLVPEDTGEPESFAPIERFPPLTITDRVEVTPLLTPDSFPRFVIDRLAGAKKRVWVQNQYLEPDADGENFPELDELLATLGELAETPATDSFPTLAGQPVAPKPFVSALPRALLSHPNGAALGVFGHVDRTLMWSLRPPEAPVAIDPFARAALHVLTGNRLGAALEDLNQRGATLAANLASALRPGAPPIDDVELVRTWTQQRDACAFLLLGDPAARLRR